MSKLRSIDTAIWSDNWFENLTPVNKLLFIYLITNDKNNMLGIYEISIRKISFETGIEKQTIEKALKDFERVNKVLYRDGYIILNNFIKHQCYNPNMKKSAITSYNELPKQIKFKDLQLIDIQDVSKGFQTLCECFGMLRKIEVEVEDEIEDEIKNESCFSFDDFWEAYPVKKEKSICLTKYASISEKDRELIKSTINAFIEYKPFESYSHPYPIRYLRNKRWTDVLGNQDVAKPTTNTPNPDHFKGFIIT
jgi:hypothetical protein